MRRLLSISLLLLFTLPLISPLFAASKADANLPACCRRNGKHHCIMAGAAQRSSGKIDQAGAANLRDRCPYNLTSSVTATLPFLPDEIQATIFAGFVSNLASLVPTETPRRISYDRSHQKRGPPSLILSRS